jgi:hypothetical protein
MFTPELIESFKTNCSLCENNMVILRLLLEEVFNYLAKQLTQIKIKNLKNQMFVWQVLRNIQVLCRDPEGSYQDLFGESHSQDVASLPEVDLTGLHLRDCGCGCSYSMCKSPSMALPTAPNLSPLDSFSRFPTSATSL